MRFSDSLTDNLALISEVISGMPPDAQRRARAAAMVIEEARQGVLRDSPNDPAVAAGIAWAVYFLAQRLVDDTTYGDDKQLIQVLS